MTTTTPTHPDSWLSIARAEVGQREIPGAADNPRIVEYHAATSLRATDDETPWCSSFVNWVLAQADIVGTKRARALSWLSWPGGAHLSMPWLGAVGVIDHGGGRGHVGFVVGVSGNNYVVLLGGNQRDAVSLTAYSREQFVEFVLPLAAADKPIAAPAMTGGFRVGGGTR